MAFWDGVKNFMGFEGSEYEEEQDVKQADNNYDISSKSQPRIVTPERKAKGAVAPAQMQVIIVKPDHFEDVKMIADHINAHRSVVLNLEASNRETSRRIIDFISGATYANHGTIKKVAGSTFMITPSGVDIAGEDLMEEYEY